KVAGGREASSPGSAVDCVWRRLPQILRWIEQPWPRLVAIPQDFVTAYPRRNKQNLDPEGGLATIEALFIAAAFLKNWDLSLLKEYHFGPAFLEANGKTFEKYRLGPA
ncbi:hypothetical protein E3A20_13650, partial [Planctomyces bekefii]